MRWQREAARVVRGERRAFGGVRRWWLLLSSVPLAACSGSAGESHATQMMRAPVPSPAARAATAARRVDSDTFVSEAWRFRIDVPPGWAVRHDFQSGYLANGAWKSYASPDSHGQPVVALSMPGSNNITDAETRIGTSRDAREVHGCIMPPTAVRPGSVASRNIHGVTFTTFETADAAMSHHLDVQAYRTVRDGACYAIDLLVFGANPAVHDPPATPPFSDAHAFEAMREVLQSLEFVDAADPPVASASTVSR